MFKEQLRSSLEWRICYPNSKEVGRGVSQKAQDMLGMADGGGCHDHHSRWDSTADQSGVQPNLRRLAGLRSSCSSSIFTTPSCPFSRA